MPFIAATPSKYTITFSTNPSDTDTITFPGGYTVTFNTTPPPTVLPNIYVLIGATKQDTANSLAAALTTYLVPVGPDLYMSAATAGTNLDVVTTGTLYQGTLGNTYSITPSSGYAVVTHTQVGVDGTNTLRSEDFLLASAEAQNVIDMVQKSIGNLTISSSDRTTAYGAIVDCMNDLRAMDVEVWDFINAAADVDFPVYTIAEKYSRGPFLSNSDNTVRTAMLTLMAPMLQAVMTKYVGYTNTPLIASQDNSSGNTLFVAATNANFQTAYADLLTKLNTAITLMPGLTTH